MIFEILTHDQVEFNGLTYERYLIGSGPERGLLNLEGEWFRYTRDWFQPPVIQKYIGSVNFDGLVMVLDNY